MPKPKTPPNPVTEFKKELEILKRDAESAKQFFYIYLTIHDVAKGQKAYRLLNHSPLFWTTVLSSLQISTFIALGRIFDQKTKHNIDSVLRVAQKNQSIFSTQALGIRKQQVFLKQVNH